ncbi:hypothetical protein [Streptomyces sp. Sce081]|uniref:hypothetical protein n=1 Tax=Streptomyces sp. Sce081 TaxID=3349853 RepID=UPI0035F2DDBF
MSLELRIRDGLPAETEAHLAIEPVRGGYGIVDQCGQERLVSRCAPVHHDKQRDLVVGVQERELPTRPKTEVAPAQGSAVGAGQLFKDVADRGGQLPAPLGRQAVILRWLGGASRPRRCVLRGGRLGGALGGPSVLQPALPPLDELGFRGGQWSGELIAMFPDLVEQPQQVLGGPVPMGPVQFTEQASDLPEVRILLLGRLRFKGLGRFQVGSDGPTLRPGRGDGNGAADQTDEEVQDAVALS